MNPHCNFDFEDSKILFLPHTPAHDDPPPHQICLKRLSSSEDDFYCPQETHTHGQVGTQEDTVIPI